MKILHILSTDRLSGAENVHLDILRALASSEEFDGAYASPDGPIREAVEAAGVRFIPVDPESPKNIASLFSEFRADLVHACDPRMSFKCAAAGVPFISHLHNNCPWMKKLTPNSAALRYAVRRARAVIAVSDSVADDFIFRRSFKDKLSVIPNTVDRKKVLTMAREGYDAEYDLLFVGRLTDQKRPLLFLDHVAALTREIPSLRAAMLGEGELLPDVKSHIASLGLTNVDLRGFDINPYRVMARSKIIVFTSSFEGFGLVAVEGAILGLPVVAYPVGGITKIAERCGFICSSDGGMRSTLRRLLSDSGEYAAASERAARASYDFTDTEGYVSKIKAVYLKSCGK